MLRAPETPEEIIEWLAEHLWGQGLRIDCYVVRVARSDVRIRVAGYGASPQAAQDFDWWAAWLNKDLGVPGWAVRRFGDSTLFEFTRVRRQPVPILPDPGTELLQGSVDPVTKTGCPLGCRLAGYTQIGEEQPMEWNRRWKATWHRFRGRG
jgi:hypothetical protein